MEEDPHAEEGGDPDLAIVEVKMDLSRTCPYCNVQFSTKLSRSGHIPGCRTRKQLQKPKMEMMKEPKDKEMRETRGMVVLGENGGPQECECGKILLTRSALTRHRKRHCELWEIIREEDEDAFREWEDSDGDDLGDSEHDAGGAGGAGGAEDKSHSEDDEISEVVLDEGQLERVAADVDSDMETTLEELTQEEKVF